MVMEDLEGETLAARLVDLRLQGDHAPDDGSEARRGPLWSPDASQILFRSNRAGINRVYSKAPRWQPAGGGRVHEYWRAPGGRELIPTDYSRGGTQVLFASCGGITSLDMWVLSLGPPPAPPSFAPPSTLSSTVRRRNDHKIHSTSRRA